MVLFCLGVSLFFCMVSVINQVKSCGVNDCCTKTVYEKQKAASNYKLKQLFALFSIYVNQ